MSDGLPPGWASATLGQVCEKPQYGWTTKSAPGLGLPYLRTTDISGGEIDWSSVPSATQVPDDPARFLLNHGDIVVSRAGSVGISHLIRNPPASIFASYLIRLRVGDFVVPEYVALYLKSPAYWRAISETQVGIAIPNVNAKRLAAIGVPIAPLAEQIRIVSAIEEHFSRLDAAETTLRQILTRLDALRTCILADAFHCRDDLPSTWHWSMIGDVAEVRGGIQKQPKRKPNKNPAPFLRVANVLRGELRLDEIHKIELFDGELERYRIRHGDLLVVEGNGSPAQIGRAASWFDQIPNCVHQNHLIRVSPGPSLSPKFLSLYWNAPHTASLLREVASSTSGLYTLSTRKIKSIPIPIAPLAEQERIAARVDGELEKADRLRESVQYALDRVTSLRRSVLATAFSGRLVPQDPDDELASVLLERIAASRPAKAARQGART